jgi:hypothetical protein
MSHDDRFKRLTYTSSNFLQSTDSQLQSSHQSAFDERTGPHGSSLLHQTAPKGPPQLQH